MTSSNGNISRVTGPLCGNSPVTGEFSAQRPVSRIFDVFFDLRLNKRLSMRLVIWNAIALSGDRRIPRTKQLYINLQSIFIALLVPYLNESHNLQ